jgi:hypothetical protein
MVVKSPQAFDIKYPVAFGAGLAAAVLCLVVRQATLPALVMACLAPLPIMIATLGFGAMPGLSAVAVGAGTIIMYMVAKPSDFWTARLLAAALFGAVFALMLGLPAWWLARLAKGRGTQADASWSTARRTTGDGTAADKVAVRDIPLSRILAYAVLLAFCVVAFMLVVITLDNGGYSVLLERWAAAIAPRILDVVGTNELPAGMDLQDLSRLYVRLIPPFVTSAYVLLFAANLWLAGRIVQVSNLLVRPWPDIAGELRMPRALAVGFLASLAAFVLAGFTGAIVSCIAAALGTGFALEGLAVTHVLTRGLRFRGTLLAVIYVAAAIVPYVMLVPFALLGLLDAGFAFRERMAGSLPLKT